MTTKQARNIIALAVELCQIDHQEAQRRQRRIDEISYGKVYGSRVYGAARKQLLHTVVADLIGE